ncbi:hypothetical protein N7508_007720 [Penicillium antarcticum]|uniref:uncharacterized protein n=1 Tax=Penicillium antarcticum TaxID=416450 RepID=UPI002390F279|nr:uncharacterized protein N7508_007720 [Penicillium antarcticum]KAJ5297471.1 hypothetical protein N7508_007720 [Penicillium antarcticum]
MQATAPRSMASPPSGLPHLSLAPCSPPRAGTGDPPNNIPREAQRAAYNCTPEIPDSYIPIGVLWKTTAENEYPVSELALLQAHDWIQTKPRNENTQIFILPDDAKRGTISRSSNKLRAALKIIMSKIDTTRSAWNGVSCSPSSVSSPSDSAEDESLWYIFNTLQNPNPQVSIMRDPHARQAMEDLLDGEDALLGLKTALYPYQRRSAAAMVQREAQPAMVLDPRLQAWKCPDGSDFYYDKEDGSIVKEKRMYSEACGGILAETMGCGKTLISLAVILATRGHFPQIPIKYQATDIQPTRKETGSLMEMAAATAGRLSVPWKPFFESLASQGEHYDRCIKACKDHCGSYEIPPHQTRYQGRNSSSYPRPPAQRIFLCSGTIIVVPPNLVDHWEREIATHTVGLKVLILRTPSDLTPSVEELQNLDIILFSKSRFEREVGEPVHKRRMIMQPAQTESTLLKLHWLRVIVDEGHNVAGHGSNMVHMLKQLHFERRWIISGTPSTGLYGVEVSLASQEANTSDTESPEEITAAVLKSRKKTGNAADNELKDLDRMRRIVIEFLDLKPWSNSRADDPADWTTYIKPMGADGQRRKSPSLRATLQSLVVRHQLHKVDREITLPKLYNKVVYLEPTFHDKLSINLFLFGLAVNAITSERQGPDYMFGKENRKHLNQVISNLRQAGFWWAGSSDVQDTAKHALGYLEKNYDKMTPADINQLTQGLVIAEKAINSPNWHGFKKYHELGVFVQDFPEHARSLWALDSASADHEPLLLGITQARHAQQYVTKHLRFRDPAEGLPGAGIKVRRELIERDEKAAPRGAPEGAKPAPGQLVHSAKPPSNKSPKKTFTQNKFHSLPETSPLKKTKLVGVSSAKLRYLLDEVHKVHKTEKTIIFYDNPNTAFWIAEGLELTAIDYRIYASTLKPELRTSYLKLFRESEEVRVLLMDLRQASHGLHIAQASRVFIVNPIWQPNVESQAIKRAHRIGQTRPVYVETLVLRNTLEDRMLRRRKEMSEAEMQNAEKSLLDDLAMADIIQHEPFLEMGEEGLDAIAPLQCQTGFFDAHRLPIPDDEGVAMRSPSKRRHLEGLEDIGADSDVDVGARGVVRPVGPSVPKRPRIGFAEGVHARGVGADARADAGGDVPPGELPVPSRPRIGFVVDVQVLGDAVERSPTRSPKIESGDDAGGRRVSPFGP